VNEPHYDVAVTKPATVCVGRDRELAELASRVVATATRDDDQVAVDCQAVQVAFEVVGADDVEDGIDPTAVGGRQGRCDEVVDA
jgi:hypothetical protein